MKRTICITLLEENLLEELEDAVDALIYCPGIDKKSLRHMLLDNEYNIIFTNPNNQGFKIDENLLSGTKVRIICTASTGTNHIDLNYCKLNNIMILSITKDMELLRKITSTAEHSFGLMLSIIRNTVRSFDSVKEGSWNWENFVGRQLNCLKIGIIGYGRLGKMMAHYCSAFGANVKIYDPYVTIDDNRYFQKDDIKEIFASCDVISLHVHVSEETKYMINNSLIDESIDGFYLINTSRGEIINEDDVIKGLESGKILGYASDVLESEFDDICDSKLCKNLDKLNIIITPHIAGMTSDARMLAYSGAIKKLKKIWKKDER